MDEGILALFEYIQQDFLVLSLEDFTKKAINESATLDVYSAIGATPLISEWTPYWNARTSATREGYPLKMREDAYKKLKYIVDDIITRIKSGAVSIPKKRIVIEVVNAISDAKIKQICIELNNTPDQNVLSLAQSLGEALQWTLWYQAQKVGTSIKDVRNMKFSVLLDEAINLPYYSGNNANAADKFLKDFKYNFLKTGYDLVRHDPTYIPDIKILNPAIEALEHVLRATFP